MTNLETVGGRLYVYQNAGLSSFDGLGNLTSVGTGVTITSNDSLRNLSGLGSLASIGNELWIASNRSLSNLSGITNLTTIQGDIGIHNNPVLSDISALSTVNSVMFGGLSIINNTSLTNLNGLQNITALGAHVTLDSNPQLISLTALSNLKAIGGDLHIISNSALVDLTGLDSIDHTTISDLMLTTSPLLSTCNVKSICEYLHNGGMSTINNNAPGCNSEPEVVASCTASAIEDLANADIQLFPNPAKESISIAGLTGKNKIEIYDLMGRLFLTKSISPNNEIDISALQPGIYFIQIENYRGVMRMAKW